MQMSKNEYIPFLSEIKEVIKKFKDRNVEQQ